MDVQRSVAYEQAHWIAAGFHEPNKMPKFKPIKDRDKAAVDEAENELNHAKVRGFFMALAMRAEKEAG